MVELKAISYEESRLEYFRKQRDSAKRRMNYWCGAKQANRVGCMEASDRASEAGAQYNFYKDALEALAAQSKWISVEERLPEQFVFVLVYMPDEYPCPTVHEGYLRPDGKWDAAHYLRTPDEVTHWANLPEPPKDDA